MVLALYVVVLVVPFSKLLRRVGFSGWWSIHAVADRPGRPSPPDILSCPVLAEAVVTA
jgi:hypothetical protein